MKDATKDTIEIKFEARSVGHMALKLLVTPVNPDAPPEEHVRLTNQEILDNCRANFPDAKTSPACIAWYASKLRTDEDYRHKHGGKVTLPARKVTPAS